MEVTDIINYLLCACAAYLVHKNHIEYRPLWAIVWAVMLGWNLHICLLETLR